MRRYLAVFAISVLSVVCVSTSATAQRVSVSTMKGETIEGLFRGATESELVIEIAGQRVRLPISDIRLISFVGQIIEPAAAAPVPPGSTPEAALKALDQLRLATEIGVLRDQYNDKLLATLPPVLEFIQGNPGTWRDVRLLLQHAVEAYRRPLGTVSSWQYAPAAFRGGANWVGQAKDLAADPREASHVEDQRSVVAIIGQDHKGRLGTGDAVMTEGLDPKGGFSLRTSAGAFNDVYRLTLSEPSKVFISLSTKPSWAGAHLALFGGDGKRIAHNDNASRSDAQIDKTLPAGLYELWAGSANSATPGTYTLRIIRQ